jgi:hypothetical protein
MFVPLENGRKFSRRRLAKYRRLGGSELQKCTVNRKGISFTYHQQPMNRIPMKSSSKNRTPSIENLTVKRRYLTEREVERLMAGFCSRPV